MSNAAEHMDGERRIDELLDRLIRAAAQRTPDEFVWPPDEIILAYIQGRATEAQRDEIQTAVAQSSEFRHFLADTAATLTAAATDDAARSFDAVCVPPSLGYSRGTATKPSPNRIVNWLGELLNPRSLVPVIAGAAVILMMLSFDPFGLFTPTSEMFAAHSELDRSLFVSMSVRNPSAEDSIPKAATSSYEAALERLRESVAFDLAAGAFKMSEGNPPAGVPQPNRTFILRLIDDHGKELGKISASFHIGGDPGAAAPEAWIVCPPAMTLWRLALPNDSLDIQWQLAHPTQGCATFTHRTDSGYVATPGQIFQL